MSRSAPRPDLEACVFFIEDERQTIYGTAFLVAGKQKACYLVTDTHVLEDLWGTGRGYLLNLQSASQTRVKVRCIQNNRVYEAQLTRYLSPFEEDDVAFLLPLGELPSTVHPVQLSQWRGRPGDEFHARGFREAAGIAIGEIVGREKMHTFPKRREVLILRSDQIGQGMSGAPVQASASGEVVGIVHGRWIAHDHGPDRGVDQRTAYAIPSETLAAVCDDLRASWIPTRPLSLFPEWIEVADAPPIAMVFVPKGEFVMGHTERKGRQVRGVDHSPRRSLHLESYAISKYPITNELFAAFIHQTGYSLFQGNCTDPEKAKHPVVSVTWYDALKFCEWLHARGSWPGQHQVRLATEAEWEKAMRGEHGRVFPWGNDWNPRRCNASVAGGFSGTTPVGYFSAPNGESTLGGDSPYGCADGAGNVWEWTLSKPAPYPFQNDARNAPDGADWRVLRGGSWSVGFQWQLHTYFRLAMDPATASWQNGFRIVLGPRLF